MVNPSRGHRALKITVFDNCMPLGRPTVADLDRQPRRSRLLGLTSAVLVNVFDSGAAACLIRLPGNPEHLGSLDTLSLQMHVKNVGCRSSLGRCRTDPGHVLGHWCLPAS